MNLNFQRAVDRYAGVPICALLSLVNRVVSNDPDGTPPKNIEVDVRNAEVLVIRMSGNWDDNGNIANDMGSLGDARLIG